MSAIFARPSKGKGVIHKRVENRRLSTLLCARAASAHSPPRGAANLRLIQAKNLPPVRSEHACGSSRTPLSRTEKGCSQYSR